jgi:ABC-type uncharacterized transport system ATPase subunit
MSIVIPIKSLMGNLSGGNVHGTVWAREFSSGTPRLLIAANFFFSQPTP